MAPKEDQTSESRVKHPGALDVTPLIAAPGGANGFVV